MLCVLILYISDIQFIVDSESQIFWETIHGSFNSLSEFLQEICWKEIAEHNTLPTRLRRHVYQHNSKKKCENRTHEILK